VVVGGGGLQFHLMILLEKTFCSSVLSSEFGFLYSSSFIHGPAQLVFLKENRIWKPKCSPYILYVTTWVHRLFATFQSSQAYVSCGTYSFFTNKRVPSHHINYL
jgi:hypothetical protein